MKLGTIFIGVLFLWHRLGTVLHIFIVAKYQKGLPDFSESPIKSSFLLITQ